MRINLKAVLVVVILIAFAIGLLVSRCAAHRREEAYRKDGRAMALPTTDTVRVTKLEPIKHVRPIVVAPIVQIESKPDTVARKRMERSTIITSIEKRAPKRKGLWQRPDGVDSLHIRTISPEGIVVQNSYAWRAVELGNFTVDSTGKIHKDPVESEKMQRKAIRKENRKAIGRKILLGGIALTAFIAGMFIAN